MTDDTDLLTVAQTIQRLQIGRTMLYQLIDRGELRSITINRRRLIPRDEIQAFILRKLGEAANGKETT